MTASELALAASKVINVLGIIILSSSSAADKKMESEISKVIGNLVIVNMLTVIFKIE
jgi:hypothetical protein